MARKPLSQKRTEITQKMDDLRKQMAQLEKDEIEAVGRIAKEAGLIGLDIPERQLKEAFKEIASRFSNPATTVANAPSEAKSA